MKNIRLNWARSARAALAMLAAGLALCSSSSCYAAAGQDVSELAAQFERLSRAALLAGRGSPAGFKQLRESREAFGKKLQALRDGRHRSLCSPMGLTYPAMEKLDRIAEAWAQIDKAAATVSDNEESMRQITAAVKQINDLEKPLTELTQVISALKLENQRGPREISVSQTLVLLHMRLIKNANLMLSSEQVDPEVTFQMARDANDFAALARGQQVGSDQLRLAAAEGDELVKLTELNARFEADRQAAGVIHKNEQKLVVFKSAVQLIVNSGEGFFQALLDLEKQIGVLSVC